MGKGIVDTLRTEFSIHDTWLPFEIHPETPPQGVLLADCFPGMNPKKFFQELNVRGEKLGVRFGSQTRLSNSRQAMEGGEFAKEAGQHEAYHEAIFKSFFTDGRDIGDREVILHAAREAGLNENKFQAALDSHTYLPQLEKTSQLAKQYGINVAPTFIIKEYGKITGAPSIEKFRNVFSGIIQGQTGRQTSSATA